MLVKFWGFFLLLTLGGMVNASDSSPVLFQSPEKTAILAFLDKQFEGAMFPGKFNYQDENFFNLIDSFSGKLVNQEKIANFVRALKPYYRKNIADQREDIPGKNPLSTDRAVLKKQDSLLTFFCKNMEERNPNVDARAYFTRVANLAAPENAKL